MKPNLILVFLSLAIWTPAATPDSTLWFDAPANAWKEGRADASK